MRFAAYLETLLLVASLTAPLPAHADTNDCASPPGPRGTIRCESDQIAICEARGNRLDGQCLSKRGKSGSALAALILTNLLGKEVKPSDVSNQEYQEIIKKRQFKRSTGPTGSLGTDVVITFSYDGNDSEAPTRTYPTNKFGATSFSCTACINVNGQKVCDTKTADSKNEAGEAASEALKQKLIARLGFAIASELKNPSIDCN